MSDDTAQPETPPQDAEPTPESKWKRTTPTWLWVILGFLIVGTAVLLAVAFTMPQDNDDTVNTGPNPSPTQVNGSAVPGLAGALGAPYIVGKADAPVTVTVYSDIQCPFCAQFHEASSQLINAAVESGNAKAEYYVASFLGEPSVRAANALACASEQGAFNTYMGTLYLNQAVENSPDAFTDEGLIEMARLSQVASLTDFEQCVKSNEYGDYVASINGAMEKAGYTQTPTVLINGEQINLNDLTFDQFQALLNGARP